jgi:hypothetical protein
MKVSIHKFIRGHQHRTEDDMVKKEAYSTPNVMETSRGCPHKCAYCAVTLFWGYRYRFRPIQEVVDEIRSYVKINILNGFIDDAHVKKVICIRGQEGQIKFGNRRYPSTPRTKSVYVRGGVDK